ncbi:MAG: hypothetical protein WCP39_04575 [Chlamydiota bacterium]
MYFLTLISSLLILLSMATHALYHETTTTKQREAAFVKYMKASRHFRNTYENKYYKATFPSEKKIKEPNPKEKSLPKKFHYTKEKSYEFSRLNIFPLLIDGKETHPELYNFFLRLIDILYGQTLFSGDPTLEKHFINGLIDSIKNENFQSIPFEKIRFKTHSLQATYYRMIKGSKGLPSILDYITGEQTPSRIYIPYASREILLTFLDEKIVNILEKKKLAQEEITSQEFDLLLSSWGKEKTENLRRYMNFSKKKCIASHSSLIVGKADDEIIFSRKLSIFPFVPKQPPKQ